MADSADRATAWSTAFRSSFGQGQGEERLRLAGIQDPVPGSGSRGRLPSRCPHGSGRAEFPHPALRDTDSLRGERGPQDACPREWIALQQLPHAVPRHACPLRAATEPLAPDAHDLFAEVFERFEVPGDPGVECEVEISGEADEARLRNLIEHVDEIAEIPNSLRRGTPVRLAGFHIV